MRRGIELEGRGGMTKRALVLCTLLAVAVAGCGNPAGNDRGRLAIRFATPVARSSSSAPSPGPSLSRAGAMESLLVRGSNGTLRIEDVRMIVSGFELEAEEGACVGERAGCEAFESGPFVVDLPLTGGAVTMTRQEIPAARYTALEFRLGGGVVPDTLRTVYPAFPGGASIVVRGTFTPAGGSAQPFTVYFAADGQVRRALEPPAKVPGADALTVVVDPAGWFRSGGQVVDPIPLDGRLVELEAEESFGRVEVNR